MTEEFLYYIWQYKLFAKTALCTSDNLQLSILKSGTHNKNAGPDFLNAQLKIDEQLWVGNVEMHVKSSDWYLHNHEEDTNFDAVILHVVWEHDAAVFMKNNQPLPTFEIKNFVDEKLLYNYNRLIYSKQSWIPCGNQLKNVEGFLIDNWLERLFFERLEQKSVFIKEILKQTNYDFEAVLFQLLAKNFGLKVNGDAFLQLAKSLDFVVVRKERFDVQKLTALFFGQAGFLEDEFENEYHAKLKIEYNYLKHKYGLKSIAKNNFQFFRMRPQNFPTIRIAQLASLIFTHQNLFSKLMNINKKEDFYKLFSFDIQEFWKTHYTFESESKKSAKKLTKSFVDLLLINTIIPLKFLYLQSRGAVDEEEILRLIRQISSEKNSIIDQFSVLKINSKNALESQALLELKNNYCTKKRCLQCAIGNNLVRN
ncbi:DUF2851 family protein [uncultured Polaribacter sp.]|uniref:DUF2851 family protein n=1 Tax=uncultured Polaribacter sp. TaxID=174711 RepID=UPI0030DC4732|tara:strand:- start:1565 stop:2836 length:1272 start_codon:yes stop_codon:yes gene_type:complete